MNIFTVLQTIVAVLLIVVILMQNKSAGVGGIFGGGGESFRTEKRGLAKTLFQTTIVLALIFIGLSLANLLS